jgi:hypothetical protein
MIKRLPSTRTRVRENGIMKPGRNDPCPCGSGKKYKACCLAKAEVSTDFLYDKLSDAYNRLSERMLQFAHKVLGEYGLSAAMAEFLLYPEDDQDDAELSTRIDSHPAVFFPWLLFNWVWDPDDFDERPAIPIDMTIAEAFLKSPKARLDPLEKRIIEATIEKPFSFYEVIECRPNRGFRLKDVFLGQEVDVSERSGSQHARAGDIFYARVVRVDAVAMLAGCGSILIPPDYKPHLIRFRPVLHENRNTPITLGDLDDYDFELREIYFGIYDRLMTPPQIRNTDGDPLVLHRLHYEIDSAEVAFDRLKALCVTENEKEMLADAQRNNAGRIHKIDLTWSRKGNRQIKSFENTILGHLHIDGRSLKIEVNSAKRAERIRREVKKRLGEHAVYKTTEILTDNAFSSEEGDHAPDPRQEELLKHPEVREHLAKVLGDHWSGWVDTKIPALGGKTPRQAVKTPAGRESVEALLLGAERDAARFPQLPEMAVEAVRNARRALGLDKDRGH